MSCDKISFKGKEFKLKDFKNIIQDLIENEESSNNNETNIPNSSQIANIYAETNKNTNNSSLNFGTAKLEDIDYEEVETLSSLASSDKNGNIKIRKNISVNEFFDYFTGKENSKTSSQKKVILKQLSEKNVTEDLLKHFLNSEERIKKFLIYHELSHIVNKDSEVYFKNGRDYLTQNKINIEVRATIDSLYKILKETKHSELDSKGSELYDSVVFFYEELPKPKIKPQTKKEGLTYDDLNEEQKKAYEEILEFFEDYRRKTHSLVGFAGSGKTTSLQVVIDAYRKENGAETFLYSTPTHKANAILKNNLPKKDAKNVYTIHGLLGLSLNLDIDEYDAKNPIFELQNESVLSKNKNSILIIDESSMLNDDLYEDILSEAEINNVKILFVGDSAQLRPVKQENNAKALNSTEKISTLQTVMRANNNSLLNESMLVRKTGDFSYKTSLTEDGRGVEFIADRNEFLDTAEKMFSSEEFEKNALYVRVLANTNKAVADYNQIIRNILYKDSNKEYVDGEILMAYDNFIVDNTHYLQNSGDYKIQEVSELTTKNISDFEFNGYKVSISELDGKNKFSTFILSKNNDIKVIEEFAKTVGQMINVKDWKNFYKVKKSFITPFDIINPNTNKAVIKKTIDYGYAHTVHKSQGGTYENILIDNVSQGQFDLETKQQLKYVGVTRAKSKAIIYSKEVKPKSSKIDFTTSDYILNGQIDYKKIKEDYENIFLKGGEIIIKDKNNRNVIDNEIVRFLVTLNPNWKNDWNFKTENGNTKVTLKNNIENFNSPNQKVKTKSFREDLKANLFKSFYKEVFKNYKGKEFQGLSPLVVETDNVVSMKFKSDYKTKLVDVKNNIKSFLNSKGLQNDLDYKLEYNEDYQEDNHLLSLGTFKITFSKDFVTNQKIDKYYNDLEILGQRFEDLNNELGVEITEDGIKYRGEIYENTQEFYDKILKPLLPNSKKKHNIKSSDKNTGIQSLLAFNSPYQNRKKPVGDNFGEYLNHKKALLEQTQKLVNQLHRDIKNPKIIPLNKIQDVQDKITQLNVLKSKIEQQIVDLENKSEDGMFHSLFDDIKELKNLLQNPDMVNISQIRERIEFLNEFITGKQYNKNKVTELENLSNSQHKDYSLLQAELNSLNLEYSKSLDKLRNKILESDITYQNNVVGKLTADEIKQLTEAKSDINILEQAFLGVAQSSRNNTIIPQVIKSILETNIVKEESVVNKFKTKLENLAKKLTNRNSKEDFSFVFERDKNGVLTGNLIDIFSPNFKRKLQEFYNIDNDTKLSFSEKQRKKIVWTQENMEVIDFRKLNVVKQLYGQQYGQYFRFSDTEIQNYENELKKLLGPNYDDYINQVLQQLELMEQNKNNIQNSNLTVQEKNKELVKNDAFIFIQHYYSTSATQAVQYQDGNGGLGYIYHNLNDFIKIPKKEKVVGFDPFGNNIVQDTGFYNKDFDSILNDPDKLEYWKTLKEIYTQYINPTYNNSSMSFAKFEKDMIEELSDKKNVLLKGSSLIGNALKTYREYFFEKGTNKTNRQGVVNNYSDNTKEDIKNLKDSLKSQTLDELRKMADDLNIKHSGLTKPEIIHTVASQMVYNKYSLDINKTTGALLDLVALQKAKQNTLPQANILFDSFKDIKDENGNDRKRAIEKLEYFIERVIKNNSFYERGTDGIMGKNLSESKWYNFFLDNLAKIPFIKNLISQKKGYLLSETEKDLFKYLSQAKGKGHSKDSNYSIYKEGLTYKKSYDEISKSSVYFTQDESGKTSIITEQEFEKVFQEDIQNKIDKLGLDLNGAGILQGILKTIILKALGLNPVGGIFNRIEGKNSGLMMDQTGEYWTTGNINKANSFMAFANILNVLPERMKPSQMRKYREMQKFKKLLEVLNVVQDRKNVLDKNVSSSINNLPNNIFKWAVDNPEFKNQGAVVLSILMDTKITDVNGNEVSVFDGKEFTIWELQGEKLVLKPEFRTQENINNWENFEVDFNNVQNNQFLLQRNKIKQAISRSQGNYDEQDSIMISKNVYGQILTLFKKWMPEHIMQRFSAGKGFDLVTGKQKQKGRYRYLWDNNPALLTTGLASVGISLGLGPMGMMIGGGIAGVVAIKSALNMYSNNGFIKSNTDTLKELSSFLKTIAIQSLNYPLQLANISKGINTNLDGYQNTNLSQEEIGALRAVAKEIAVKLTWTMIGLMVKSLLWDDDDENDSTKRQFANFTDNQITRLIATSDQFTNPISFYNDATRISAVQWTKDVIKLADAIQEFDEDKMLKQGLRIAPIPKMLTNGGLGFLDDREYQSTDWFDIFVKDSKTDGEYSAKKEYDKLRKNISSKFKDNGLTIKEISKMVKPKEKNETYKQAVERIKSFDN